MSDTYYNDTIKAVENFENLFYALIEHLTDGHTEAYNKLLSEVDMLLSEYKDNLVKIEDLEFKVEDLENMLPKE